MKSKRMLTITLGVLSAMAVLSRGQAPAPALRTGPGVQAGADAKEPEVLATCKTPPPGRGGAARGGGRGPAVFNAALNGHREYAVTEIPGVIAAGTKWKEEIWQELGLNADGIIGTKDGGLLLAQNDKSDVVKLDKDGKPSVAYTDTNTGGGLSMSSKGVLFIVSRGLHEAIVELAPKRRIFADKYQGDPLDCIGGELNDLVADSKGGVYFNMGPPPSEKNGVFYADAKGVVTKYSKNLNVNGIALSPDEKTLYVTNGMALAAFDVQKDGSLTNQRDFATWEGGAGDGSAIDAAGRVFVSTAQGVRVIGPDGKYLGLIPTPRPVNSLAFSGPDKKTLFAVAQVRDGDPTHNAVQIISIQTLTRGPKGRAK
jgi:gluconolactonase